MSKITPITSRLLNLASSPSLGLTGTVSKGTGISGGGVAQCQCQILLGENTEVICGQRSIDRDLSCQRPLQLVLLYKDWYMCKAPAARYGIHHPYWLSMLGTDYQGIVNSYRAGGTLLGFSPCIGDSVVVHCLPRHVCPNILMGCWLLRILRFT